METMYWIQPTHRSFTPPRQVFYGARLEVPFDSPEAAQVYAANWNDYPDGRVRIHQIFNIVDDAGRVVLTTCSTAEIGRVYEPGELVRMPAETDSAA